MVTSGRPTVPTVHVYRTTLAGSGQKLNALTEAPTLCPPRTAVWFSVTTAVHVVAVGRGTNAASHRDRQWEVVG